MGDERDDGQGRDGAPAGEVTTPTAPGAPASPQWTIGASDLGRRVRWRRQAAHLDRAALAERTGMSEPFIAHLETAAVVELPFSSVYRLAVALGTTPDALTGSQSDQPDGTGPPGPEPTLLELTEEECWEHLRADGIGRIVVDAPEGPTALPVNFAVVGGGILVRVVGEGLLETVLAAPSVGFEADCVDNVLRGGWSVVVTGTARPATDDERSSSAPRPWAAKDPAGTPIFLEAHHVSGRRLLGG